MAGANLGILLGKVLDSASKGFIAKAMAGAGITFASTAGITALVNQYISTLKSGVGSIPIEILGIMHLSGIDYAMSVILSAIVARIAIDGTSLHLAKATK